MTTTNETNTDRTALYWSEKGAIACLDHAPYPRSDTWVWDGWQKISALESLGFARDVGRPPRCETCAIDGRMTEAR